MADAIYNQIKLRTLQGLVDYDNDIFNVSIHGSNFVNDSGDQLWSDIITTQTSGTGYSDGGTSLSNVSLTLSGAVVEWDFDDPSWTTATFTGGFAVLRAASGNSSGYLMAAQDFGGTQSVNNGTFSVQFNAAGIIQLS